MTLQRGPAPNIAGCACRWRTELVVEGELALCPMHERTLRPLRWETLAMMLIDVQAALHEAYPDEAPARESDE